MTCQHDLAERETACADGMCPLCLHAENKQLRAALRGMLERAANERVNAARTALAGKVKVAAPVKEMTVRLYNIPVTGELDFTTIMEASEMLLELSTEIERLRALAREVGGCWGAFEGDLRNAIGHTNYNVVARKLEAVLAGKEG